MTQQAINTPDPELLVAQKIRRLAAKNDLVAHKSRKDGNWYFSDFNNILRSPEQGLEGQEALDFLAQE
jgi:hypothetical protein